MDSIAERVTAPGGMALDTARMTAQSRFPDFPPVETVRDQAVVEVLAPRYAVYAAAVRSTIDGAADYDEAVTADLLTQISATIARQRWFLEAHLLG